MNNFRLRKIMAVVICLLFLCNVFTVNIAALDAVSYVDENGISHSVTDYTVFTGGSYCTLSDGVYVVNSNISVFGAIYVSGNADLILCDGVTLESRDRLVVNPGATLNIYGQSAGTGTLKAISAYQVYQSNRSDSIKVNGQLIINSGTVNAVGEYEHTGITGSGVITINGGTVTASGGTNGAGIGGSYNDNNASVTGSLIINGGTVTATGGSNGAGIGGAGKTGTAVGGSWGTIEINGGTVTASSGHYAAAIGCGYLTACGNITINGGTVTATPHVDANGTKGEAFGKYGVYITGGGLEYRGTIGAVEINGGNVTANGSIGGSSTVLDWTSTTDSIYATEYTSSDISILNDFQVGTQPVLATPENIAGQTIHAYNGPYNYVNLYDDDGVTPVASPIKVIPGGIPVKPENPTKTGYTFVRWESGGSAYNFNTAVSSDIDVLAKWDQHYSVSYIGTTGVTETLAGNAYTEICSTNLPTTLTNGYYVVGSGATYNTRITIQGDVGIILRDGYTLNLNNGGIRIEEGNTLTVFGQTNNTGKLICSYPGDGNAAIGSNAKTDANTTEKSGNIFIYGGEITATASNYAAGIGGGRYSAGGYITLNGGKVTAKGVQGAAIGDGYMGIGSRVDITGGTVIATGGAYSAAIGGSNASRSGVSTVNISGGTVTATAYSYTNSSTHVTTTYYGIGAPDASKAVVNLDWTSSDSSIFATNYNANTINFQNNFVLQGTNTVARPDNIDGNRIVPCTSNVYTVDFYDETDSTPIYSQIRTVDGQTVARPNNPTKTGYRFVEWRLNGVAFDFSTPITANTVLRAHWVEGGDVHYIDANGVSQVKTQGSYEYIETTGEAVTLSSGWYVVSGEISLAKRLVISGTVNIILSDGCVFDVPKGITCTGSNTLNIYAQSGSTGELNCKSPDANNAAIGGVSYAVPGNITINGGVINAKASTYAAAIGGGSNHGGGNITINGGEVNAVAGTYSAAIGSAYNSQNSGDNTVIVINGGNVTATSSSGSAIGAGYSAVFDSITINGGYVSAASSGYHAGIGGRAKDSSAQPIVINGGYVSAEGGRNSAAIGARDNVPMKAVTINGGTVIAAAGTNGTGIGDSPTYSNQDCVITLNWTSNEDTYNSDGYTGVVTFAKDFILDGTTTAATASNINGVTIIPDVDLTVRFLDTDGVTELFPYQTVKNGMSATQPSNPEKFGFIFNGWLVDGFPFDFSYVLRSDTDIIADFQAIPAVGYIDENGDAQTCTAYYTVDSSTTALSNTWYAVTDDTTVNSRISVSGTVNLILCDGVTLTAVKGIEVPDGATLNIYAQSGRTGALEVTLPDNNTAGIGVSNGEDAGTININGGVITVESGVNAAAIGGGNSGSVTFNGGNITANGFVGADMAAANGDGYSVTLNWTNASDSYYATIYKANITLENDFFYSGTTNLVDIPLNGYTTIVPATNFVEYYDGFGNRLACTSYTVLTDASAVYLNDGGWYVVNADTTITRAINVNGTSHIILCDGATLRAQNITVGASGAVYIYGQKENTGKFRNTPPASGTTALAGIGGSGTDAAGEIHILGGIIYATGYYGGAGIGGALNCATSIEIARATVYAQGSEASTAHGGAGIGSGLRSGQITIHSGKITAIGGYGAAGIGSGYNVTGTTNKQFEITIYGGEIDAQGGSIIDNGTTYYGAGIGGGTCVPPTGTTKPGLAYGDVNIWGGQITANSIGAGDILRTNSSTKPVSISLSWTNAGDFIEADSYSYYTLTFAKDFFLDGTTTPATQTNIAGNRIVPTVANYDVNEDGFFDVNDVAFVMAASVGETEMTSSQEAKADVNGDTVVDGFDAAIIDRKLYQIV